MSKKIWASQFPDGDIFCSCKCHSDSKLVHPEHCISCTELHKPENYHKVKK